MRTESSGAVGRILLVLAATAVLLLGSSLSAKAQEGTPSPPSLRERLEAQKLREEIQNLRRERSFWAVFPSYAGLLTAIAALVGLFFTAQQHLRQRKAELRQQEAEATRRLDEHFNTVVTNLGSDSPALQASAAASLLSFLREDASGSAEEFREQVFWLLVSQLKIERSREVNQLLVRVFERAIRFHLDARSERADREAELDLSRANLKRVDLSGIEDLPPLDLAWTRLDGANLRGTRLRGARGIQVNVEGAVLSDADLSEALLQEAHGSKAVFHGATMQGVKLQKSILSAAQFQQALLQSAHFEGADLRGAAFHGANVDDAFFQGAKLDAAARHSLAGAKNVDNAHFSPDVEIVVAGGEKER